MTEQASQLRGMAARSYLYVPGDRPDHLARAGARGADALILDLEDSVPVTGKARARQLLAGWLAAQAGAGEWWVRINPHLAGADIAATVAPPVRGVVVPKADPALLNDVDHVLTTRERALGLDPGHFQMLPFVETAQGLLAAASLAAAPRVVRLGIGEADLAAGLGIQAGPGDAEVVPLRLQIVVASAAAGIAAPVGPVFLDYADLAGLRESAQAMLRLGFRAGSAIHPAQVATINAVFTPAGAEVTQARRLVAAFEEAERGGRGVITDERGRMIDAAVIRAARDILARAQPAEPGRPIGGADGVP